MTSRSIPSRCRAAASPPHFAPSDGWHRPNCALIQIAGEKPGDGIERAIVIEILVAAVEKPHEMFRLVGEVEQRFAHDVRNDPVVYAMHDHDRRGDLADAQV